MRTPPLLLALLATACLPDLDEERCETDDDCGAGLVCDLNLCVRGADAGPADATTVSGPDAGPDAAPFPDLDAASPDAAPPDGDAAPPDAAPPDGDAAPPDALVFPDAFWIPDTGIECGDGARQTTECGLNLRGSAHRICERGQWSDWSACDDIDECTDGHVEARACGRTNAGMELWRCDAGLWMPAGPCNEPVPCADGVTERRECDLDERGVEARTCEGGVWSAWGPCLPEECVDTPDPTDLACTM